MTLRGWPGFWASGASAKKDLFRISVHICICAVVVFYPRATRAHGRGVISSTNTSGRRLPDYLQICILVYMYTHHVNVIHIHINYHKSVHVSSIRTQLQNGKKKINNQNQPTLTFIFGGKVINCIGSLLELLNEMILWYWYFYTVNSKLY